MTTLKVRYSSFDDKTTSSLPVLGKKSATETMGIYVPKAETPVYFRLNRRNVVARNLENQNKDKEQTTKKIQSQRSKILGTENKPRDIPRFNEHHCRALLRERIFDVAAELKNETNKSKTRPFSASQIRKRTGKGKETEVSNSTAQPSEPNRGTPQRISTSQQHLSTADKVMLKQVISSILKKKVKQERHKERQSLRTSSPTNQSGRATAGSRSLAASSQVTPVEMCTDVLRQKVQERINSYTEMYNSDISSSGDMSRHKKGGYKNEDTRPSIRLFSVASSSRGSTAEWIIKQKFEKYRR